MNDLGFSYIDIHEAWLHIPTSSVIFLHEIFTRSDEELKDMIFERTGENPSDWLIEALKYPYDDLD